MLISKILIRTGLPHTQEIQANSENFQVKENLRETQGISGNFDIFFPVSLEYFANLLTFEVSSDNLSEQV